jgi:hypothetical protein
MVRSRQKLKGAFTHYDSRIKSTWNCAISVSHGKCQYVILREPSLDPTDWERGVRGRHSSCKTNTILVRSLLWYDAFVVEFQLPDHQTGRALAMIRMKAVI